MLRRRKARKKALEILYEHELIGVPIAEILERRKESGADKELPEFTQRLIEGVLVHQAEIDRTIESKSEEWLVERMPSTDRNILRICLYEMLYESDIPISVSINEAVEMAKEYGTEDSSRFVNGILGRIAEEMEERSSPKG